jgi:hypothetical protein
MKIAHCITGHPRSILVSNIGNVLTQFPGDVFVNFANSHDPLRTREVDAFISRFNPVRVVDATNVDCDNSKLPFCRDRCIPNSPARSQYIRIDICFQMIRDHRPNGYDWITRLRPDLYFMQDLPSFTKLDNKLVYAEQKEDGVLWDIILLIPRFRFADVHNSIHNVAYSCPPELHPGAPEYLLDVYLTRTRKLSVMPLGVTLLRQKTYLDVKNKNEQRCLWLDCWRFSTIRQDLATAIGRHIYLNGSYSNNMYNKCTTLTNSLNKQHMNKCT